VGRVYARGGLSWPGVEVTDFLAEHEGAHVVRRALARPEYAREREQLEAVLGGGAAAPPGETPPAPRDGPAAAVEHARAYLRVFRTFTRLWARGELPAALSDESWQMFRSRVQAGVRSILDEAGRGAAVIAFTSGGPIGSTVAWALGLDDEQALELAWIVENATVTEILHGDGRVSLKSFNVQPRLGQPELVTYV
jgi:hypothetical protein